MVKIGVPAGVQGMLFSISNVLIQSSVNSFGSIVMAGNTASLNIENFVYISMNAIYQTNLSFTSQNMGARQFKRIDKILLECLGIVVCVGLILGWGAYLGGNFLLHIYSADPEVIRIGLIRLSFICTTYFLCGIMDVMTGVLRGIGASMLPMAISVAGVCGLRIAWIFSVFRIPAYHTPQILYLSYTISWTATFLAELLAYLILIRKKRRA